MSLSQFIASLRRIKNNPKVSTVVGVSRHLVWQTWKVFNSFPRTVSFSSSQLYVENKFCGVGALANNQGLYDYNAMRLIADVTSGGGGFLDVGANVGSYTIIASEPGKGSVISFEPHPGTYKTLVRNIELNGFRVATPLNMALGSTSGTLYFTSNPVSSLNHVVSSAETGTEVVVPVYRLDEISQVLALYESSDIVAMKADVEGFELDVLLGAGDLLLKTDILFLEINELIETRGSGKGAIEDLLGRAGFIGPYFPDYDERVLKADRHVPEDSLYLSARGMEWLSRNGWVAEQL